MQESVPSRSAYRVALRRATHQLVDRPLVFDDPLALRILGLREQDLRSGRLRAPDRPASRGLRAFPVARSRWAEDALHACMAAGTGPLQYVLLGAGLDTFACRTPYPALRIFEVDHPATQCWKLQLLRDADLTPSATTAFVPVDFKAEGVTEALQAVGWRADVPTVYAWLGVVPYLSIETIQTTLRELSGAVPGSCLLLDYHLPRSALSPVEQLELDSLTSRVAASGEPFRSFFLPEQLHAALAAGGWQVKEDLHRDSINARYFADRADGLRVLRTGARLLHAERVVSLGA